VCIVAIVGATGVLAFNGGFANTATTSESRTTSYGELVALIAFGISWLTASHFFPVVTSDQERLLRRGGIDQL
jgi:hypothetical protein